MISLIPADTMGVVVLGLLLLQSGPAQELWGSMQFFFCGTPPLAGPPTHQDEWYWHHHQLFFVGGGWVFKPILPCGEQDGGQSVLGDRAQGSQRECSALHAVPLYGRLPARASATKQGTQLLCSLP